MKKKFSKLLVITLCIISIMALIGCNKPKPEENVGVSDLVGIKVNNYMAEWENPAYNFTYEGSNTLKVSVPYTKQLKITDLLTSPNSTAKVYEDKEYSKEITDKNNIAVDGEKSLYINVQNSTKNDQQTKYKVDIKVEELKGITEEEKVNAPEDNRDGHIYIPESYKNITIDEVTYQVIRTTTDYDMSIRIDKTANIILANDLYFERYTTVRFTNEEGYMEYYLGNFNGNNYNITIDHFYDNLSTGIPRGLVSLNKGILKNIRIKSNKLNLIVSDIFIVRNSGTLSNCVNFINFDNKDNANAVAYAIGVLAWENEEKGIIKNNINYGYHIDRHNTGKLAVFAMDNSVSNQMYNNINVGEMSCVKKCSGIVSGIGTIAKGDKYFYNYNLGKISGNPEYQICQKAEEELITKKYNI